MEISGNNRKAEVFFSLFMQNQRKIYAYILMLVHNRNDADDIMQETATILWGKFGQFDHNKSFSTWAIGVARNKILQFRQQYSRSRVQFNSDIFENICERADFDEDQEEYSEVVSECVSKLKDADQQILNLRYHKGLNLKNIANHMGRSSQGIYKTMARIHLALQECVHRSIDISGRSR